MQRYNSAKVYNQNKAKRRSRTAPEHTDVTRRFTAKLPIVFRPKSKPVCEVCTGAGYCQSFKYDGCNKTST
jgi:hypothetical protein